MFIYSTKRHKTPINVSSKQLLLLRTLGSLGFVNSTQLNLLWSVINKTPSEFSKSILSSWCTYDGLLKLVHKSSSSSPAAVKRSVYVLTSSAKRWLDSLGFLPASDDLISINSHNEQAIEVVVQSLYSACFKSNELGISIPFYLSNSTDNAIGFLSNSSFINRCQNKGELKGVVKVPVKEVPEQKELVFRFGAKVRVKKRKRQQSNSIATNTLISTLESLGLLNLSIAESIPYITYLSYCLLVEGLINDEDINSILNSLSLSLFSGSNTYAINSLNSFRSYMKSTSVLNAGKTPSLISNKRNSTVKAPLVEHDGAAAVSVKRSITTNPSTSGLAPHSLSEGMPVSVKTKFKHKSFYSQFYGTQEAPISDEFSFWQHLFCVALLRDAKSAKGLSLEALSNIQSDGSRRLLENEKEENPVARLGRGRKLGSINNSKQIVDNFNDLLFSHFMLISNSNYLLFCLGNALIKLYDALSATLDGEGKTVAGLGRGRKLGSIINSKQIVDNFNNISLRDESIFNDFLTKGAKHPQNLGKDLGNKDESSLKQNGGQRLNEALFSGLQTDLDTIMVPEQNESDDSYDVDKDNEDINKIFKNMGANLISDLDEDPELVPEPEVMKEEKVPEGSEKNLIYTFNELGVNLKIAWVPELWVPVTTKLKDLSSIQMSALLVLGVLNLLLIQEKLQTSPLFLNDSNLADIKLELDKKDQNLIDKPCWESLSLISNPRFNLEALDLRSFNRQFGFSFGESKDLPFVADMMISFKRAKNKRRQEIFVELDNRTESNDTQIQKILNYVWYALDNKHKDIFMVLPITDGSLSSRRVPEYTNIGRKLGNLASKFVRTFITGANGEKVYLGDLYQNATNLRIFISGVSEAHIDIAECLLGSNYLANNLLDIEELTSQLNKNTDWKVNFIASKAFEAIKKSPELLMNSEADINLPILNDKQKGMLRYLDKDVSKTSKLGELVFTSGSVERSQSVYSAQEHSLDSLITNYLEFSDSEEHHLPVLASSVNIFPPRLQSLTAISLPEYAKKFNYLDSYIPVSSYYIQPRNGIDLQYMKELRWLTIQYSKDIYNYFSTGAINKAAAKKGIQYSSKQVKLLVNDDYHARSFEDLHLLATNVEATKQNKSEFIQNLVLNEVPEDLYKQLLERWPKGSYNPIRLQPLFYIKNPLIWNELEPKDFYDFYKFIKPLNSTIPLSRKEIFE